jgi:ATP-binding cassette, subfamily F, member 3
MFSISNISLSYPGKVLFNDISFFINLKDRIGLVGKNGSGKTTLLNIFVGITNPDKGTVNIPGGNIVAYLPQEPQINSDTTVYLETLKAFDEINSLGSELILLNEKLTKSDPADVSASNRILNEIHDKQGRLHYLDENQKEENIERVLKGLGFLRENFNKKVSELSGGWQTRVELAKILLKKPDLLLLDEPTNHLDIHSIIWLENYLKNFDGAVILVSHDKMFLDHICTRTIELVAGRIYDYKVAYSKFMELRKERFESQLAIARSRQKIIEQQERFISRFKYKATKAKQVQSRVRRLEKMEQPEIDETDHTTIDFSFPPAPKSGAIVLEGKQVYKRYVDLEVLKDLDFVVEKGDRIAFVGKNGEGKTTLVKMITGTTDFIGTIRAGYHVNIGYYAQVQDRTLDEDLTVLETIEHEATGGWSSDARIRGLLGAFLFREDDVDKRVKVLSGGEKSRLAIAKLLLRPSNLLILDEPTNHLDISAKEVLKNALKKYEGTLILVSHDRDFLEGLTHKTWEFKNKHIKVHLGSINEFLDTYYAETFREFEIKSRLSAKSQNKSKGQSPLNKEKFLDRKEQEREIRKLNNAIHKCEQSIVHIEKEIAEQELLMQSQEFYKNVDYAKKISYRHNELKEKLHLVVDEWEHLLQRLEEKKAE